MHGPNDKMNFSSSYHNGSRSQKNATFKARVLQTLTKQQPRNQNMHKTKDPYLINHKTMVLVTK